MSGPATMTESRRPLLYEEEQEFTAFDDDELQAAAKLRRKRQRYRVKLFVHIKDRKII